MMINKFVYKLFLYILIIFLISGCQSRLETRNESVKSYFIDSLPTNLKNLEFVEIPVSTEFTTPYEIYMKVDISEEEYIEYTNNLGLFFGRSQDNPYGYLLPGKLSRDRKSPDWWPENLDLANLLASADIEMPEYRLVIATAHDGTTAYITSLVRVSYEE